MAPGCRSDPLGVANLSAEDGKVMDLDCDSMPIKNVMEEVDRHARKLQNAADIENAS